MAILSADSHLFK